MRRLLPGVICAILLSAEAGVAAVASFANITNGVWSTGVSPSNVVLVPSAGGTLNAQEETHYILIKLPAGCAGVACQESIGDFFGPTAYLVLGGNGTFPLNGTWPFLNDGASSWIGPRADQRTPAVGGAAYDTTAVFASDSDFYVYRMPFSLSLLGLNPATAAINLSWLSDNGSNAAGTLPSHIRLCSIAAPSDPVCSSGSQIASSGNAGQVASSPTSVNITSGFGSGLMALDFVVYNSVAASGSNPSGLRVQINSATADTEQALAGADLAVTKDDGVAEIPPGGSTTYTIVVTNNGPGTAAGAPVSDTLPAQFASASWTCTASLGSTCASANGTDSITTMVTLLPAGTATFVVNATLDSTAVGTVTNTATVGPAPGAADPDGGGSATDTDVIGAPVPTLGLVGLLSAILLLASVASIVLRRPSP